MCLVSEKAEEHTIFVNISNKIGDNVEDNIGDNVCDIGVLSAGEGGGGEGRCRLAPLAG